MARKSLTDRGIRAHNRHADFHCAQRSITALVGRIPCSNRSRMCKELLLRGARSDRQAGLDHDRRLRGDADRNPKEHTRNRILTDAEIRTIWKQAEGNGRFGAIVRLALLTGQRRTIIAAMKWEDLSAHGVWTIPLAPREKRLALANLRDARS
jgi:integrase